MSFDEQAAKAFLESKESSFDESAAMDFLRQEEPKQEQKTLKDATYQMLASQSDEAQPGLPKTEYSGLTKAMFGNEVPDMVRWGGEWGAAGTSTLMNVLGMPADAFNWALRTAGADTQAWGGSQDLRKAGEKIGISYETIPDTPAARAGEFTAIGLEFLAPALLFTRTSGVQALNLGVFETRAGMTSGTVLPAASVPRGVAQTITAPFVTNPGVAMATELTGSIGSGVGSYYGGKEYGQIGEMVGGVAGGFASIPVAMISPSVARFITGAKSDMSITGGKIKASNRLHQLAETDDVSAAISREQGNVLPGAKISPAKLSGDRHLLALENEILKTDPALAHQFLMREFANNKLAMEEAKLLGGNVPITQTQAHIGAKVAHIKELINKKVDIGLVKAKNAVSDISPAVQRRVVNSTVRKNLDDALSSARGVEKDVWSKVQQDITVPTATTRNSFAKELTGRAKAADPEDIPNFLYQFLGKVDKGVYKQGAWGEAQTVKEMQALRSRVLDVIRAEKAKDAPSWNKVRILDDIQENLLTDMANASKETGVEAAIKVSREINQKFRGDIMDTIFGNSKTGGKLAPELTLSSIKSGPKAAVEMRRVMDASPDSTPLLEELVKLNIAQSKAIKGTGDQARINVPSAKRYMLENEDIFDLFPKLKEQMDAAIGLEERAIGMLDSAKIRLKRVEGSTAAKIAAAKPQRVWTEIIKSADPALAVKKAMNRSNDIGKRGVKNDAVDYLLGKSKTGALDDDGISILSGKKFKNELSSNRDLYKAAFNKDEMRRLDMISETLAKNEGFSSLPDVGGVISPKQGVFSYAIVTMATRAGALAGKGTSGASLRTSGMASRVAQNLIDKLNVGQAQKILKDSIQDPELFKAVFEDTQRPADVAHAVKVLHGWMIANVIENMDEDNNGN